ncbi:MAG: carbohydrate porin [Alphaproteobacteria bacterium]|nr:carbohydrate porin [Alphaproteobacteria bacterium]
MKRTLLAFAAFAAAPATSALAAEPASPWLTWEATLDVDVLGPVAGLDHGKRGYVLDESSLIGTLDLGKAGWKGASLHGWLRNTGGQEPNERLGTIEGVSNLEARQRLRLYEFYLQQNFGGDRGDVRVGLIGFDSSFYVTDSSGLLVNPAFGIPAEIAATGSNGPSIYPSSSLAIQATWRPVDSLYAQVGAFNAKAGTIGDPGDVDTRFDEGALVVGEVGVVQDGKLAVGAWTYTEKADDIRATRPSGAPERRTARGAYLLMEQPLNEPDGPRAATTFFRLGVSDGKTTEIAASTQAGIQIDRVFEGRPDSKFAAGIRYTRLTDNALANAKDDGIDLEHGEYGVELSYADNVTPWLAVQPNLQVIADPGGRSDKAIWVAGVRLSAAFSGVF